MKKTLVALAVLAAAGTSFAQVTITGKLGFSYQKSATLGGGSANHGMAMADGDLNFAATEDLGGGMSATAKSAFASRGRDNTFAARDASLTVAGSSAVVTLGSVESCSAILNTAGAPVSLATGHDGGTGNPIDGCANIDVAQLTIPMGPVSLTAAYIDSISRLVAGAVTGPGGAGDLTANLVGISYAAGPLTGALDMTVYSANAAAQAALALGGGTFWDGLTRTRLYGAYDLGVAKVGVGFQVNNHDKASQSSVSVNVPLGAVSVGLVHSMRASQAASTSFTGLTADDSRTGTAVGATYNLSKMTNINASYGVYSTTPTVRDNEFRVRLMKSF
jgi:predicted porin